MKYMNYVRYIFLPAAILIILLTLAFYSKIMKEKAKEISLEKSNYTTILQLSASQSDSKPIQDFLVKEIKSGDKSNFTQSAAYWMSHRYFDNGGDIYEVYDYVKANPELSFLNEAEQIYPDAFKSVKDGKASNYSSPSLYAYLGYLEIFEKYNYLNLPGLSTLTNKYAELAYYIKQGNTTTSSSTQKRYEDVLAKSIKYQEKASVFLDKVMGGDISEFANKNDAVVGLTQYANAMQFYRALGVKSNSKYTAKEVFDVATNLAKDTTLNYFVNYSHAISTIIAKEINADNVKAPLAVITSSIIKNPTSGSVLYRIVNSKTSGEFGMYSFEKTKTLARYSPEFRSWLLSQGWVAQDFYMPSEVKK